MLQILSPEIVLSITTEMGELHMREVVTTVVHLEVGDIVLRRPENSQTENGTGRSHPRREHEENHGVKMEKGKKKKQNQR